MPTTYAIRPIHPVKRTESSIFKSFPLDGAADFEPGTPVTVSVGGEMDECDGAGATGRVTAIAGFALAGTADYEWKDDTFNTVVPAIPFAVSDQEFRGTLEGTFEANDIGQVYGLAESTDDIWVVDKDLTTNSGTGGENQTSVIVVGVDDEVEVDDINVPCRFIVLRDQRQVIY